MGSPNTIKLLAVDDDYQYLKLITAVLTQPDLEILTCNNPENALEMFSRVRPQIVLVDLMMPQVSGMELLERMVRADPVVDIILITGLYSSESAVEAIQKGACDYLEKSVGVENLRRRVDELLAEAQKRQQASRLDHELLGTFQFEGLIGRSPLMLDVFAKIRRVAPHFRTVLVTGPTGSGKELVAKALHHLSPASPGPFAACNCSAISETLVESELFGYVRGAFTGATRDKLGLFEYANGGTVFLDEVGELSSAVQAKLLRVLQNQEVQRVGSPAVRTVDVRVIAATNRDLRQLAAEKRFRDDLYYRLSTVEIKLPTLADRKEDLPLLQRHFIAKWSDQYKREVRGITRRAQTLLARYSWPGNVRELENVLGNACMMAEGNVVDIRDLPEYLRQGSPEGTRSGAILSLQEMNRRYALDVLQRVGGNKVRAAGILGISRVTLYKLLDASGDPKREDENTTP